MPESEQTYLDKLSEAIRALVLALSSRDGILRETIRRSLVAIGEPAVGALIDALRDRNSNVRWEAAKALRDIAHPKAAPAMVQALNDDLFGVRWLAAEGLIVLGPQGLKPLLQALVRNPENGWLREGAHHVLKSLTNRRLHELTAPVVASLERLDGELDIVTKAHTALDELEREDAE